MGLKKRGLSLNRKGFKALIRKFLEINNITKEKNSCSSSFILVVFRLN